MKKIAKQERKPEKERKRKKKVNKPERKKGRDS